MAKSPREESGVWGNLGAKLEVPRDENLTHDPREGIASKGEHLRLMSNVPFIANHFDKNRIPTGILRAFPAYTW